MKVAVIGGGIQGTCVAMALANRGIQSDVIEAKSSLMDGASRHSEGKIHLGFVYAKDVSLRTAQLQMRGAAVFERYMRHWLGAEFDEIPRSTPFKYVVHHKTMISPDRLQATYGAIGSQVERHCADGAYFGVDMPGSIERLSDAEARSEYGEAVDAVFSTQELAIDPDPVADLIVKKVVDTEAITIRLDTMVTGVDTTLRYLDTFSVDGSTTRLGPYDHVVNCAWEGRPAIDAGVGLPQRAPWSFRMKYFLKTMSALSLPSSTIVLGPFGDVVQYENGEQYLTWYPSSRLGWSTDLTPPSWPTRPRAPEADRIARQILANLAEVVPAAADVSPETVEVRGGVIFALGQTDIDDPTSQLHQRSNVGVSTFGVRYLSIDTGKYTTAPLFAHEAAERLTRQP